MSKQVESNYTLEKRFEDIDFTETPFPKGEYEVCTFANCNFSGTHLSNIEFSECTFSNCNLSTAELRQTALREVYFKNCKLVGLYFENCNDFLFAVHFEHCILNLSSFYKLSMKKTQFKYSNLHEVDFTQADISGSLFDHCDFAQATFDNTIVEKADFRTSINYSIDPERNRNFL